MDRMYCKKCKTSDYSTELTTGQVLCTKCNRLWYVNYDPDKLRFPTRYEIEHAKRYEPNKEGDSWME